MSWFRYHTDALDNPKIQNLPAILFRFWVNCLCISQKHGGFLPEIGEVSFRCRTPEPQARNWIGELIRRGLIDKVEPDQLFMHDWNEHQFVSDDVTSRVRKHRAKRKGNVSETPSEQSRTDTDNRAEQTHTQNGVARAPIAADLNGHTSQRFEEFWARWPRKQHRDAACRIWISVVSVEDETACFGCLDRFLASEQVSRSVIPNPENWLMEQNRDRWRGDWPARAAPQQARRLSPLEELQQEARDAKRKA